jgi:hypothetical protein
MIQSNELRIGNLLECYIGTDNIGWVHFPIDWQDIRECEEENISFNKSHRPISLTEEWLLKFGFSEFGGCNEKDFTDGIYNVFINSLGEINFYFFRENEWFQKIDYVHELQNLYFALTKTELQWQNLEN